MAPYCRNISTWEHIPFSKIANPFKTKVTPFPSLPIRSSKTNNDQNSKYFLGVSGRDLSTNFTKRSKTLKYFVGKS